MPGTQPRRARLGSGRNERMIPMKLVIIGGSGLIGSRLVKNLRALGHEALAASPSTGVNALTGEGLDHALQGANVVVDVSNSPSFEEAAVYEFFDKSTRNLLLAEKTAGTVHHVALSIVGADLVPDSPYLRAKVAQETAIQSAVVSYTIVRATQFFEFMPQIADGYTQGKTVRLLPVLMQPIAAADVAAALVPIALGKPANGILDLAGPQKFHLDDLVRRVLAARNDPREILPDLNGNYFGAHITDQSLTPSGHAILGSTRFEDWLAQSAPQTLTHSAR